MGQKQVFHKSEMRRYMVQRGCMRNRMAFVVVVGLFNIDIFENVMCLTECRHYSPIEVFGYRLAKQTLSKDFDERLCTHITDSN